MFEYSVQKFGGSSMARPECAAEVFTAEPARNQIAVVSAVGTSNELGGDTKVTDLLVGCEQAVADNDQEAALSLFERVLLRNQQAFSRVGSCALSKICETATEVFQSDASQAQGYKWMGEWLSAQLFAELTGAVYVPSGLRFTNGTLDIQESLDAIRQTVGPVLDSGKQAVVPGFYGYDTASGKVVALERGGSDISGVLYTGTFNGRRGHWLNENYTDKDGILSADPGVIPNARVVAEMTHEEVREMMHGVIGRNGVIHGNAIAHAARLGVEICVKNTFNPNAEGTCIVPSRRPDRRYPVIAISGKNQLTAIDVYDPGMADAEGYLSGILHKIEQQGMSISHIPTSEDRLNVIFNHGVTQGGLDAVGRHMRQNAISAEHAEVNVNRGEGAVYLIGQALTDPLVYSRVCAESISTLAAQGIPFRSVLSHAKSPSLALAIPGEAVSEAMQLLHKELVEC